MKTTTWLCAGVMALGFAAIQTAVQGQAGGRQGATDTIPLDSDDIAGVVTGPKGPEAGVWVIAETTGLPTKFARIVVTDDRGRYLIPDLPSATYSVWVRGYGLVDSEKVQATPGKVVNLTAVVAPDARKAAQYYPSGYWFSLIKVPDKSEFPGTGPSGNGIAPEIKNQGQWLRMLKSGTCWSCHALGTQATREIPAAFHDMSTLDAWQRRLASGQAGPDMMRGIAQFGAPRAFAMLADWTDRVAAGEVPPPPPRPQGLERNVVITEWDWADPKAYLHDEVSTDRRDPTRNAERADLRLSRAERRLPARARSRPQHRQQSAVDGPRSGDAADVRRDDPALAVLGPGADLDEQEQRPQSRCSTSRAASGSRPPCARPRILISARRAPTIRRRSSIRSTTPAASWRCTIRKRRQITHISTCFSTHHLMFAEDANHTLWTSGGGQVVGWLNTKMFEATHDEAKSQGWTALVMDTNGNGKRDAYVEPDQPVDPDERQAVRRSVLLGRAGARRLGLGIGAWFSRRGRAAGARLESSGDRNRGSLRAALRQSRKRPSRASPRAGWTSIATASSGPRSRAGTWPASIAASAKGR